MKYPQGSKGRKVKTKKISFGSIGKSVGKTVANVSTGPSLAATTVSTTVPKTTTTPTTPTAPTAPAPTGSSDNPFASGDPWEIAKKIVDDDIAAQTKVIQAQKDQAAARNQALLNTFLGFQAAVSKASGDLGTQFDKSMADLSNSRAAFQQGFQDAQGHIQGTGQTPQGSPADMAAVARANNPFWQLPGNLAAQGQLLGAAQAKQLNDQLTTFDTQIQALSGNRMKDLFSIYS